ncbi:MAG TPA: hypothetical protein VHX66_07490 [Solirubrobacteraceae bacterium]|jgi:hypothetical protein|nr:hypothetical protein [Solirubrobacteraceae bacterium]
MSVVLLVRDQGDASYVVPRRVRWRDRLAVRLHAASLDAALAAGVAPESSPALAVRAEQLIGPVARALGNSVCQILLGAREPHRPRPNQAPISPNLIGDAEPELSRLALRLLGDGPVSVRGVALVRELLSDGRGPLYGHAAHDAVALRETLWVALEALEIDA